MSLQATLLPMTLPLLVAGLLGCGSVLSQLNPGLGKRSLTGETAIANLAQSQSGASVAVRGRVIAQAPLLGGTAFEVRDDTGSVWVLAKPPVPPPGSEVVVNGILRYQRLDGQPQGAVYVERQ